MHIIASVFEYKAHIDMKFDKDVKTIMVVDTSLHYLFKIDLVIESIMSTLLKHKYEWKKSL